jgi:GNAT superfamily N-acetyltransferase
VHHGKDVDVWQVRGPFKELTSEIVRLFALDYHRDEMLAAAGVAMDEMAAYRFSTLAEPGGALFVAERAGRLEGLLFLAPQGLQSAILGHYIWSVRQLATAPGAPRDTVGEMVDAAAGRLGAPLDCIVARVPARDQAAAFGLQQRGFEAVGSEVVGVLECRTRPAGKPTHLKLAPMQKRYLREAADLLLQNGGCHCFASPPRLPASRVSRLYQCLLAGYVEEPRAGGLVAEDESGDLQGFITYKRNAWLEEFTGSRQASLDFFGVHPDSRFNGLGELLHLHALSALADQSVGAAEVRIPATDPDTADTLKLHRRLGCRTFSHDLIFRRWMS